MILVEKSKAEVFFQNYQNSTLSVLKFLLTIQKQLLLSSLTFYFYKILFLSINIHLVSLVLLILPLLFYHDQSCLSAVAVA